MKTEVTEGEGHEVTLKIEAGPEDMADILEDTYRELSSQVKVPGFRKGKVPKDVINSHLGIEAVRTEAIKNGLPTLYVRGIRESGIVPVSDPEINILDVAEDGGVTFTAKVDVQPEVEVKDYKGLQVEKPEIEVTDDDLKQALDEARDRFATLDVVEGRPVEKGDFVMFDYKVFTDGVPLEGSSGSDRMTEIGSGDFLEGFDEQLVGARKGDIIDVIINFPPDYGEQALAGKPATFRTIVKEIKRKVLPPLDDDLAKEVSSLDTLEEFKDDLRNRIKRIKGSIAERKTKDDVVKALVDRTYVDLPESMIERQIEHEMEEMGQELSERGITLDQYLDAMKGTRHQLEKAIRERVVEGLKAELVMDAVATAENITISDEDVAEYIKEHAEQVGGDPEKLLEEARRRGSIPAIKANLRLARAVDFLVENAVYSDGTPVAKALEAEAEGTVVEAEDVGAEIVEGEGKADTSEGSPEESAEEDEEAEEGSEGT